MGIAWKGYLRDQENEQNLLYSMLEGMAGIMKSNGAKVSKLPKPKKLVKDPKEEEVPHVRDIIGAFGGKGVKVK